MLCVALCPRERDQSTLSDGQDLAITCSVNTSGLDARGGSWPTASILPVGLSPSLSRLFFRPFLVPTIWMEGHTVDHDGRDPAELRPNTNNAHLFPGIGLLAPVERDLGEDASAGPVIVDPIIHDHIVAIRVESAGLFHTRNAARPEA